MIHTVAVPVGDSDYAVAGQKHAFELARNFKARLRVLGPCNSPDESAGQDRGEEPSELVRERMDEAVSEARDQGLEAEAEFHGEGVLEGLLAGGRHADVLVVGMPTREQAQSDPLAASILHEERPLFRKLDCMILVVCDPPQPVEKVLVNTQGGAAGKRALRAAGELAERAGHRLAIVSVKSRGMDATVLTSAAREYTGGFGISAVETLEKEGGPVHERHILDAAEEAGANFLVVPDEPQGLVARLFQHPTAEEVVLATRLPVLIAR
jgi:nucleotide-binding universal stress UspA family protein